MPCFPGMPSLWSCIPGYDVTDILADVILPIPKGISKKPSIECGKKGRYINMASVRKPVSS